MGWNCSGHGQWSNHLVYLISLDHCSIGTGDEPTLHVNTFLIVSVTKHAGAGAGAGD